MRAVVSMIAGKAGNIPVARSVNHVIRIGHHGKSGKRLILPVGGRQGRHGVQVEAIRSEWCGTRSVQRHHGTGAVRLNRRKPVEERGVPHGLAAPGMAHDHDAVQVHPSLQRMTGRVVPGPELLEMF
jgi:hypothetical protein